MLHIGARAVKGGLREESLEGNGDCGGKATEVARRVHTEREASDWLSFPPWFWFHLGKISCAMYHGKNLHRSLPEPINNSVTLDKKFPYLWVC